MRTYDRQHLLLYLVGEDGDVLEVEGCVDLGLQRRGQSLLEGRV